MTFKTAFAGLSRQEEAVLVKRAQAGDRAATHALLLRHTPLVQAMASKYVRYASRDDLANQGFLGLLVALPKFDPARETRFATYARWWARYYMQRWITWHTHIVQASHTRNMRKLEQSSQQVRRRLEQERGRTVAAEEIAEAMGVPFEDAQHFLARRSQPDVLALEDDEVEVHGHAVVDPRTSVEDQVASQEVLAQCTGVLASALHTLDSREREVIRLRLLSDDPPPLRELGERMGVSGERIRQLQRDALRKMRSHLEEHGVRAEALFP